jgi:hypothetical protein
MIQHKQLFKKKLPEVGSGSSKKKYDLPNWGKDNLLMGLVNADLNVQFHGPPDPPHFAQK